MQATQYRKASIVSYEHGKVEHSNVCCLKYLENADGEFAKKLDGSDQLCRFFEAMTSSSDESEADGQDQSEGMDASGILGDEAAAMAKICIELALLNRATFACTQKCVFQTCYDFMPNDKTLKDEVKEQLDDELKYVSQLVRRFDSPSMIYAKHRIAGWLSTEVEGGDHDEFYDSDNGHVDDDDDDGNMSEEEEETNDLPNVSDNED